MRTVPNGTPTAQRERAFQQLASVIEHLVAPHLAVTLLAILAGLDPAFGARRAAEISEHRLDETLVRALGQAADELRSADRAVVDVPAPWEFLAPRELVDLDAR